MNQAATARQRSMPRREAGYGAPATSYASTPNKQNGGRHRRLSLVRAAWGLILIVLASRSATGSAAGVGDDPYLRRFLQILGVRHVVEALVCMTVPSRRVLRAASVIDATHATTMVALAGVDKRRRDIALTSAAVAACWSLASGAAARQSPGDAQRPARGGGR